MSRGARIAHRGLTWPGDSWLHRAPVGAKVAVLFAASIVVIAAGRPWLSGIVGILAVVAMRAARIPMRVIVRHLMPIAVMVAIVVVVQILLGEPGTALVVGLRIMAVACVAVAVTLTTTAGEIAEWVESVLRRLGFGPGRVLRGGMLVGIAMRSIDHLVQVAASVSDARRARGLQRSMRAFAVPTVIAAARYAHGMGEALEARGLAAGDDDTP